jgi:hypothetical protein
MVRHSSDTFRATISEADLQSIRVCPGSKVYIVPTKSKYGNLGFVLTPFSPANWGQIYQLDCFYRCDKPGLINAITKVFANVDVNIQDLVFLTDGLHEPCSFEIGIDLTIAFRKFNIMGDPAKQANFIKSHIIGPLRKINKQLGGKYSKQGRVVIHKNKYLNGENLKSEVPAAIYQLIANDRFEPSAVYRSHVLLTNLHYESVGLSVDQRVQYFTVSNPQECYIKLQLSSQRDFLISLNIDHQNAPGALESITENIKVLGNGQFNILKTSNRFMASKGACRFTAIVDLTAKPEAIVELKKKENWIKEAKRLQRSFNIYDIDMRWTRSFDIFRKDLVAPLREENQRRDLKLFVTTHVKDFALGVVGSVLVCLLLIWYGPKWRLSGDVWVKLAFIVPAATAVLHYVYQTKIFIEVIESIRKFFGKR